MRKEEQMGIGDGDITRSERLTGSSGRQYHIACAPGDLASFILVCGDPDRVKAAEPLLDSVRFRASHREFTTITGEYHGIPVSVISSGIGCDNIEIVVIEAAQCVARPTFIRIGSCGGIQTECGAGDLVITEIAVRRENTSLFYVDEYHVPRADHEVLNALVTAAQELNYKFHVGATCSTSSFYAGQGSEIEGFPVHKSASIKKLVEEGVLNFEMEMSTLFTLADISTLGIRAGGVCAVYDNRARGEFIAAGEKPLAQERCIRTGLRAVEILSA